MKEYYRVMVDIVRKNRFFVILLLISTIILSLYNSNSFLYKSSVCCDAGVYYNVAKGMLQGKVLYIDIYDHKGPFIFFIYALFNLLFPGKLFGAYLLDVICYSAIQIFSYRLLLRKQEKRIAALGSFIFALILIVMNSSYGCPEIWAVVLESVIVYWAYSEKIHDKKYLIFIGVMTGIMLMTKFTLTAFPFVMFLYFLYYCKKHRTSIDVMRTSISCLVIGMLIPIMITFIYLIKNSAVKEFIEAYIITNKGYASIGTDNVWKLLMIALIVIVLSLLKIDVKDKIIYVAIMIQFSLILVAYFVLYTILPILVFNLIIFYKLRRIENKWTKLIVLETVVILGIYVIFIGFNNINMVYEANMAKAKSNDIVFLAMDAYAFNEESKAPENKYFFTPNLDSADNEEMWDELYGMVDKSIPENIYVPYDDKGKLFCTTNRLRSKEEIYKILERMEENYECVENYSNNIYQWKRKTR